MITIISEWEGRKLHADVTGIRFYRPATPNFDPITDDVCLKCLSFGGTAALYGNEDDYLHLYEDELCVYCTLCGNAISEGVAPEVTTRKEFEEWAADRQ